MSDRLNTILGFLKESPDDSFLHFALAKAYEGLRDDDQALVAYLQLRTLDPDYVGLYYHLGKLYERQQSPQAAWEAYTEGIKVATRVGDRHALSELAGARLSLGDEEDFGK